MHRSNSLGVKCVRFSSVVNGVRQTHRNKHVNQKEEDYHKQSKTENKQKKHKEGAVVSFFCFLML